MAGVSECVMCIFVHLLKKKKKLFYHSVEKILAEKLKKFSIFSFQAVTHYALNLSWSVDRCSHFLAEHQMAHGLKGQVIRASALGLGVPILAQSLQWLKCLYSSSCPPRCSTLHDQTSCFVGWLLNVPATC